MSERRIRWLFLVVLVGQLVLLTSQVPDPRRQGSYLEGLGVRLLAPVASLVDASAAGASGVRQRLRLRGELEEENARLGSEVERLRLEVMRMRDVDDEARRLAAALDYARGKDERFRVADVVYVDHESWLRTLVVRAAGARLEVDQPVVAPGGLVGRVIAVAGSYAKVQLATDRAAAVGAMLERTRRQGVVHGNGEGGLEMDYVPLQTPVEVGDRVMTAGIDGVYPRGIPLGTVTAVEPGSELFHRIVLAPAVDMGLLDEVFVVEREPLPPELKESTANARR